MIKNPVIVMALYDIGRDSWDSFNLSYNTYLNWMQNTLSLDCNIVIYTENKFTKRITEYSKQFDPSLNRIMIIEEPLDQLKCYKLYYEKLNNLMNSVDFKKKVQTQVPEMTKVLYNIVMFNKLRFLQDAKNKKYFNNDMLIWADAGGLRESIKNYQNEKWPDLSKINQLDNSKVTFFSHSKNINISNKEWHSLSQVRYIQGTAFMVPSCLIDELVIDFEKTIDECLENKYIGSDEKIFDLTYIKNPNRYTLLKCTWRKYFDIFKRDAPDIFNSSGYQGNKIFIDFGSYKCGSILRKIDELDIDNTWEVYAFEPNPKINIKEYAKKISSCRVNGRKEAAWRRNGRMVLNQYGCDGNSQGALLEETEAGKWYSDYFDSCIVSSIDIYEFIISLNKDKEIYIHMDIENSEYVVVDHLLKNGWPNNIKKIWIEWHDTNNPIKKQAAVNLENKIKATGTTIESIMV